MVSANNTVLGHAWIYCIRRLGWFPNQISAEHKLIHGLVCKNHVLGDVVLLSTSDLNVWPRLVACLL